MSEVLARICSMSELHLQYWHRCAVSQVKGPQIAGVPQNASLRVTPSVKDERVYAIVAKSLLPYITYVPNFWNVIHVKLFVK